MNTDHSNLRERVRAALRELPPETPRDVEFASSNSIEDRIEANLQRVYGRMREWFPTVAKFIEASPRSSAQLAEQGYNRCHAMLQRIRKHPRYQARESSRAPYGLFAQRAIIGEFTPWDQGVYVSPTACEAVVIDHSHGALERVYRELLAWIRARGGTQISERAAVQSVITVVERFIRFSPEGYAALMDREQVKPDSKTSLDLFIQDGVGLARHQVLLAGFLVERLQTQGILHGHGTIDPISYSETGDDERYVYTCRNGEVLVLDPLANHC